MYWSVILQIVLEHLPSQMSCIFIPGIVLISSSFHILTMMFTFWKTFPFAVPKNICILHWSASKLSQSTREEDYQGFDALCYFKSKLIYTVFHVSYCVCNTLHWKVIASVFKWCWSQSQVTKGQNSVYILCIHRWCIAENTHSHLGVI